MDGRWIFFPVLEKARLVSMDTTIRDLMDSARAKAFTVYPVDYFPIDASPNVN